MEKLTFIHEYRKCLERKRYNTEKSCTEITQHFRFSFRMLHSRNWKIGFLFATGLHPWKIIVRVNGMTCLWVNTIILTENTHVIMQKYLRYSVNNFTHNTSLVVSQFLWRELRLINLKIDTIHHIYGTIIFSFMWWK